LPAPDIFLSYNREDQATAQRFAERFEAAGMSVWWDVTLRSGEAYDEVTEEALRTAKAVVVLWSPRSVVSRWVRAEATLDYGSVTDLAQAADDIVVTEIENWQAVFGGKHISVPA
jgi:hypothetical protein